MAKRTNGTGSVYRDGDRWVGAITVRVEDGKPIRRRVTARTQREVREKLEALKRAEAASPGLPTGVTVAQWIEHWLTNVIPGSVTRSTAESYARYARAWIVPQIGRTPLSKLSAADVDRWLRELADSGRSANSRRLARATLRRALKIAERDGLVPRNVVTLTDGVKLDHAEGRSLTLVEAKWLLDALDDHPHGALLTFMLTTGCRKGETLGLRWRDIDLDAGTASIRRALHSADGGGAYLADVKTAKSRRVVHLLPTTIERLRRLKVRQAEDRLAAGEFWAADGWPTDLVFTQKLGVPLEPTTPNAALSSVTSSLGLGHWTPHELRHSAASLMLAAGVPLQAVSATLGHSSTTVTANVYAHLLGDEKAAAAAAYGAALGG